MNIDRLDQVLELIEQRLLADRIQVGATWRVTVEPMQYNTVQNKDFEILFLKGETHKEVFSRHHYSARKRFV